jgi:hypothetical protein
MAPALCGRSQDVFAADIYRRPVNWIISRIGMPDGAIQVGFASTSLQGCCMQGGYGICPQTGLQTGWGVETLRCRPRRRGY